MVLGTLTKTTADFSRLWMGYWFLLSLTAMFGFRWLVGVLAPLYGRGESRVLLVGDGPLATEVASRAQGSARRREGRMVIGCSVARFPVQRSARG